MSSSNGRNDMPRQQRGRTRPQFIDFEFLKERASFEDVLTHYGCHPGRIVRDEVMLRCPFPGHDDAKPSCSVNLAKKQFQCFGCGLKGSILDFVAFMEGLDPDDDRDLREAAKVLAEVASLPLSPRAGGQKLRSKASRSPRTEVGPPSGVNARPRGSHEPTRGLKEPSQGHDLLAWHEPELVHLEPRPAPLQDVRHDHPYLRERGITPELARELGIGFYGGKGLMRERIVFAVYDWWPPEELAQLVAYIGRWPSDDVPENELRWKLPKEFPKMQVVYGLYRLAHKTRHAFIVEGPFDAVRLTAHGAPAVALLGHAISPEQVELLWQAGIRFTTTLLDGDEQGRRAAPAVAAMVAHRGIYNRIRYLSEGMDPSNAPEEALLPIIQRTETAKP